MMQLLASSPLVCDDFAFAMGLSPPPLSPAPSMDLALDADTQAAIEGVCDLTFLEGLQFDRSFVDPIDLVFGDAASTLQLDWLAISPTDAPKTTVDQGAHSIQDIEQLLVGAQAADADIEALLNFDLTTPERAPATSVESAWTNSWASTADVFGLPSSPYVSDCLPDIFELCQLLDVSPPSPSVAKAVIEVLVDKPVVAVQTPASSRSKDELRAATRKVHERMYEDILSTVAEPNGMFVCPVESCSKEFNRRYNLKTHFASHLTLRPFDCPACDRTFTRRADARRHLENKHPEELEQDPTRHATRRDLVRAGFPPTKSNKARPPAAKQPAKRAREEDAGVPLRASSRVKRARGKA
ncbi:hypothetical protein HKX48_009335 [Thoreauomyces humboldtii]|nr:hypothetical protein HKX48_009335 [Thoreauomyces humboldtii]